MEGGFFNTHGPKSYVQITYSISLLWRGDFRIINNGSISSVTPRPFSAPYTLSKHAISGLTKSTALDGRAYGIACSQIDIGMSAKNSSDDLLCRIELIKYCLFV